MQDRTDFAEALKALLSRADVAGRLTRSNARRFLKILANVPANERVAALRNVFANLGRFEDLTSAAQRSILLALRQRDARAVRGREPGAVYAMLMRAAFRLRLRAHLWQRRFPGVGLASQAADALAFGIRRGPATLVSGVIRLHDYVTSRLSKRPMLGAILTLAGVDIRATAVCYARPIEQPDSLRGYWHDPSTLRTVGMAMGIDFLPTKEGFRFLECNINFAQRPERSSLYETDPYVENMLDFARRKGYRRLIVVDSNSNGIDPTTARRLETGALLREIELTLVDRENVPDSKYVRRYGLPTMITPETLLVRTRAYPISLDYIADMKEASVQALECYRASTHEADLLLPLTSAEPVLGQVGMDEPFPNLVYKLPEIDQARGVYFMKVESPGHARTILADAIKSAARGHLLARLEKLSGVSAGVYQAYYKTRMRTDRRLYIVRAHVLVSPQGVQFLSAHRVISGSTVPDRLPVGVIADPSPYLVNYSAGSWYEVVPADEEHQVVRAAEAVGRGIAWAFEYALRVS